MSKIYVNGNSMSVASAAEGVSILSSLFPTSIGFVEDNDKVYFAQNMSVKDADHLLHPNKPKKTVMKAEVKVKPAKAKKTVVKAKGKKKTKAKVKAKAKKSSKKKKGKK